LLYDCCMFASTGEKAVWDNTNLKHFIGICKEEIGVGNRPNGCFTRNDWKNLEEKFFARSRLKLVKSQLKNKLDNMKNDYTEFMELKNAATGLGWDDANQTVDYSNMWWDEHLAVSPCQIVVIFPWSIISSYIYIFPYLAHLFNSDATTLREVSSVSMSSFESVDRSTLMICISI
jgi:hypothetical protein